jgi:hypothetical protein
MLCSNSNAPCPLNQTKDACGVCSGNGSLDICGSCFQPGDSRRKTVYRDCFGSTLACPKSASRDACGVCSGDGSFDACGRCLAKFDANRRADPALCGQVASVNCTGRNTTDVCAICGGKATSASTCPGKRQASSSSSMSAGEKLGLFFGLGIVLPALMGGIGYCIWKKTHEGKNYANLEGPTKRVEMETTHA